MISKKYCDKDIMIKIFCFILIALVATTYAQSSSIISLSSEWLQVAGIIILIAFAILGIAYMVAKVFAIPQWEAWVREESINVLFSAVLIILFAAFVGVVENVSDGIASEMLTYSGPGPPGVSSATSIRHWQYIPFGEENTNPGNRDRGGGRWKIIDGELEDCPYPCHFYIARAFLGSTYETYGEMLRANARTLGGSRLLESLGMGFAFGIHLWVVEIRFALGFPIYSGRAIFNNTLDTVVQGMLGALLNLKSQEIMLSYMPGLAGVFFIVGILSRILWFLRKFGGLLVALAIGIYVFLPLIYVIGWYTIDRTVSVYGEDFLPGVSVDASTAGSLGSGTLSSKPFFTEYDNIGRVIRVGLLDALARTYMVRIVIPILAAFTLIGFVRQFSPMIGGDVEIAGLTKII